MSHQHSSHFTSPSNRTAQPRNEAAAKAPSQPDEKKEQRRQQPLAASPAASASTTTPAAETAPITNDTLTPHQIAIKRARAAKQRLATVHEGWVLAAQQLLRWRRGQLRGRSPPPPTGGEENEKEKEKKEEGDGLEAELRAFGDAICGRYAAASFLWRVLADMPAADWFGPGDRFDATLRRLRTLRGLEGSLACWESVVLDLVELVDRRGGDGEEEEEGEEKEFWDEVGRVLGRWRRGVPSRP